jgi:hypothetical protein
MNKSLTQTSCPMTLTARPVPIEWHDRLSVFASEPFLKSVGDEYGWLGGFDQGGKLCCVLPYTIVRKAIFRMVRFRVETIPINGELSLTGEKSFLNSAMQHFRSIGADMVIPATTNTIFRTYPDGADAAPYGTYLVDLCKSEESLWSALNSNHRRQIRLAQKNGVQIRHAREHLDTAHAIFLATFKRSDLPFMGIKAFRRMVLGLGENVKILVAEIHGRVQGCMVVPFSRHSAYYVYGGSIADASPGAMHLLHWEAIRMFRALGVASYDFVGVRINPKVGSKQEGLLTFKERFGGQLVQGYMWKRALSRPFKYHLYGLAARIRNGGDIVDQEHHKLGGLELSIVMQQSVSKEEIPSAV